MQVEKKKTQEQMRKLMAERKKKDIKPTKIDNPLAKYNSSGQLMCLLCSSIVRSENVWLVHINSKQHKENVEKAKKLKELTNNFTVSKIKRSSPPVDAPPEKKIKGILKNASDVPNIILQKPKNNAPEVISFHDEEIKRLALNPAAEETKSEGMNLSKISCTYSWLMVVLSSPLPYLHDEASATCAKINMTRLKLLDAKQASTKFL